MFREFLFPVLNVLPHKWDEVEADNTSAVSAFPKEKQLKALLQKRFS